MFSTARTALLTLLRYTIDFTVVPMQKGKGNDAIYAQSGNAVTIQLVVEVLVCRRELIGWWRDWWSDLLAGP
jgi:hypothetical protein